MNRLTLTAGIVLAATAFAACSYAGGETGGTTTPTLKPIDVPGLKREIAAHRGHVVAVNLWATWCDGCVAEMPDLARAAKAEHAKGLDLVTVDFDDPIAQQKKAIPFLAQNQFTTGTFVNHNGTKLDDAYPQFLEPKLGPDDDYGIPHTYLFNRKGKLVKTLGQCTFAEFQKAFQAVLAQK